MFIENFKINPWSTIFVDIFQASIVTYLVIFVIEEFKAGFASNFININWILWIAIISGVIMILVTSKKQEQKKEIRWWDYAFILLLGLATGVLIYLKIKDLNWIAWVISILSCLLIWLISYLIIKDEE